MGKDYSKKGGCCKKPIVQHLGPKERNPIREVVDQCMEGLA
jgi:hypothetical protein